jgi:hypothetical protein
MGLLVLGALGAGTDAALAQLLEAWSLDTGISPTPQLARARLDALGGMREAVPDENNEINLLDFARNVTGELDDKPGTHVDAFSGPQRWYDQTTGDLPDEDFRVFPFYFKYNALPRPNDALGGIIFAQAGTAERLIDEDFRDRFKLPVENPPTGTNDNTLLNSDLNGQTYAVHYAHRFGPRLAVGGRAGYAREEEERDGASLYLIDHNTDDWFLELGVSGKVIDQAGPFRNWVAGANGRGILSNIHGVSSDDVHLDEFEWDRPQVGFDLHGTGLLLDYITGGVLYRYHSFDGQEEMQLNWSPQFQLNPTNQTIETQLSAFEEGFRGSRFQTRWEARPPELPASFGLGIELEQTEYWLNPFQNQNSFATAKNERKTGWRMTGGGSYFLPEARGLLAGEMAFGLEDNDDRVSSPAVRVGESTFELGAAAEYAVAEPVVGRAGYRLILTDEDRDREGATQELTTHRVALGGGLRAPNGQVFIDAAFQYDFVGRGEEEGEPVFDDEDRSNFTVQVRTLF